MRPEEHLWVEKYRPNTIAECALPESMKNFFSAMVQKGNIQNLMLIGGAGLGKCLGYDTKLTLIVSDEILADMLAKGVDIDLL